MFDNIIKIMLDNIIKNISYFKKNLLLLYFYQKYFSVSTVEQFDHSHYA